MKLHNLEEHISIDGTSRHVRTILYNVPYAICKFEKDIQQHYYRHKTKPKGTYFKIVSNMEKTKLEDTKYSIDCQYYPHEFDTIDELTANLLETGMDPNYEITKGGKGIGETAFDHMWG
jgi:hypothetical protein